MPRGVLGLNAPMFKEYLRYIANRRCQQIGLDDPVPEREQPVSLDERNDRPEEGTKFLRDPRHRVPDRRRAELGLTVVLSTEALPSTGSRCEDSKDGEPSRHQSDATGLVPRSSHWGDRIGSWSLKQTTGR